MLFSKRAVGEPVTIVPLNLRCFLGGTIHGTEDHADEGSAVAMGPFREFGEGVGPSMTRD